MNAVLSALCPIFLLIALGALLKARRFPSADFWPQAERLTYFVLFPALLTASVAGAEIPVGTALAAGGAVFLAELLVALAVLAARPFFGLPGPVFSSVFQGSIRHNTYVGLTAVFALFGSRGVALASVAILAIIPLVNALSVTVVARYGRGASMSGTRLAREVAANPLILACLLGFGLNLAGWGRGLHVETLNLLGRASLTIGLLSVGAGLRFRGFTEFLRPILFSGPAKLLFLPLLALLLLRFFGLSGEVVAVMVLFAGLPASVSSFILARQLGGDHECMAAIITVQTLFAAATLPFLLRLAFLWG